MFDLFKKTAQKTNLETDNYETMYCDQVFGHPSLNTLVEKRTERKVANMDTILLDKLPVSTLNQLGTLVDKSIKKRK